LLIGNAAQGGALVCEPDQMRQALLLSQLDSVIVVLQCIAQVTSHPCSFRLQQDFVLEEVGPAAGREEM
jgi:hypothetical protein